MNTSPTNVTRSFFAHREYLNCDLVERDSRAEEIIGLNKYRYKVEKWLGAIARLMLGLRSKISQEFGDADTR